MNSRERIRATIRRMEPDRIPIDLGGLHSGIHEVAYRNLLNYWGLEEEVIIIDPVQGLAPVSDKVMNRLGVDTRYIFTNPPSFWSYKEDAEGAFVDEFGVKYRKVGLYSDVVGPPLIGKDYEDVKKYKFPDPQDPARFAGLKNKAKKLYDETEFALVAGYPITIFYVAGTLRGHDNFWMDTLTKKEIATYLLDSLVDWNIAFFERYLAEIGDFIEYFWIADDWGMQTGPLLSPAYFRAEIKPRLKKMIDFVKTKTKAKCCHHCDGSVYWLIEDMIDIGVDILQPLQPDAVGNENTAKIKREFGRRISFHSGTNNQGLFHRDIDSLRLDTLRRTRDLAPGGGYIFSSGHNIQANCPPENIEMLFDLAREFGKYPIDAEAIESEMCHSRERLAHSPR